MTHCPIGGTPIRSGPTLCVERTSTVSQRRNAHRKRTLLARSNLAHSAAFVAKRWVICPRRNGVLVLRLPPRFALEDVH